MNRDETRAHEDEVHADSYESYESINKDTTHPCVPDNNEQRFLLRCLLVCFSRSSIHRRQQISMDYIPVQ